MDARLVNKLEDWEYSSFKDYAGLRNSGFCDHNLAFELINLNKENFIEQTYAVIEEKYLKGIWL